MAVTSPDARENQKRRAVRDNLKRKRKSVISKKGGGKTTLPNIGLKLRPREFIDFIRNAQAGRTEPITTSPLENPIPRRFREKANALRLEAVQNLVLSELHGPERDMLAARGFSTRVQPLGSDLLTKFILGRTDPNLFKRAAAVALEHPRRTGVPREHLSTGISVNPGLARHEIAHQLFDFPGDQEHEVIRKAGDPRGAGFFARLIEIAKKLEAGR